MVAAAVIGGAVIGAAGSSIAGGEAAGATKSATNASIAEQQSALSQQNQLSAPYRGLGTSNMQTYQNLLTGGGKGAAGIESTLQSLPGYQATLNTGVEAAKRASAASGLNLSGNQVAGVEGYGAQLADSTYQQQLNNLLQPIQLGQAAAAGQAANIGTSASNISNALINQGNNTANIDANTIAGITKAGSNASNQLITYQTLQGLNNPSTPAAPQTYGGGDYSVAPGGYGVNLPTGP
jgi:hypothetical protein